MLWLLSAVAMGDPIRAVISDGKVQTISAVAIDTVSKRRLVCIRQHDCNALNC